MTSPFGLPSNYTTGNPLYMQYMLMMMQAAKQQQMQQQAYIQRVQQAGQQHPSNSIQQGQETRTVVQQGELREVPVDTTQITKTQNIETTQHVSGDGKDDGKISWDSKLKNFGKGVGKFFTGMFLDDDGKFSWKRTLTTVGVAAAAVAVTVATGGAAAPFLIAAGATMGGIQVGKGIYKANTAKTDAEAEKAWQDIGGGTTAIVASVAGAKGALKSAGKVDVSGYHGVKGALQSTGKCFTESGKMIGKGYQNLRSDFTGTVSNAVEVGRNNLSAKFNNTNAAKYFKENKVEKFDKEIAKLEKQISKTTDTKELAKLNSDLAIKKANKQQLLDHLAAMDNKSPLEYQTVIDNSKAELARYKEALANIKEQAGSPLKRTAGERRLIAQYKKAISEIENEIKTLEEYKKVATATYKKANAESIQTNKEIVDAYKQDIKKLKSELAKEKDTARQDALKAQIEKIKTDIEIFEKNNVTETIGLKENYAFAKAKYITPGVKELKTNRLWAGTAAVNNGFLPAIQIAPDQISELDAYAQAYGFANAQQMQEYIQAMENSQRALNEANQVLSTNGNYTTMNPYGQANIFAGYNMQAPQGNNLGFNELYVSPYPDLI